jgi:hypothetical protein
LSRKKRQKAGDREFIVDDGRGGSEFVIVAVVGSSGRSGFVVAVG